MIHLGSSYILKTTDGNTINFWFKDAFVCLLVYVLQMAFLIAEFLITVLEKLPDSDYNIVYSLQKYEYVSLHFLHVF